jgi:putative tryptophan/tyrosine transport system substrate-binding protein
VANASRIKDYSAELVKSMPDIVVANGSPVLAASFSWSSTIQWSKALFSAWRTGGNVTGFLFIDFPLFGRSLRLLKQMAPGVIRVGFMFSPANHPYYDSKLKSFAADRQILPPEIVRATVGSDAEVEGQMAKLTEQPGSGLIVPAGTFTLAHRQAILASVAQHSVPTIHSYRAAVVEGGLMSHAPDTVDIFRRSASYGRSHPQRRKAGRFSGTGADKARARGQSQHRQNTRSRRASCAALARRRGNRIAGPMSAIGTTRRLRQRNGMSAMGG